MTDKLNTSTLKQVRQARKLSIEEVAEAAQISQNRLRRFELGELEPSFQQIARLCELYNTSIYDFYREGIVEIEETLPDFRKATPTAANISPKGLLRLWQVQNRAKFVEELRKMLKDDAPSTVSLARLTNQSKPQAAELRAGFDRWLGSRDRSLRFSGNAESVFQRQLRVFLETRALQTSINSAPAKDYLGFYDKLSAKSKVVFINSAVKHDKRRLFTLSHEMAHAIYDEEGISNPFQAKNDIERRCNRFAAQFLAPDHQVMSVVHSASSAVINDVARIVTLVARNTLLSRQASTLRLQDLNVISRTAASAHFAELAKLRRISEPTSETDKPPPIGRGVVIGRKLSEVGLLASYTASVALRKKLVDIVDVERGLGLSESIQADVLELAERRFEAGAE